MKTIKKLFLSLPLASMLCIAQPSANRIAAAGHPASVQAGCLTAQPCPAATAGSAAGAIGFASPGGLTTGPNNGAANLGLVFTANDNFSVVALGVYEDPELVSSEIVGLYDQSGNLLASTTVSLSNPVTNGYLFASITPVALKAGNQYTVAAFFGNNPWDYGNAPVTDPRVTYNGHTYVYSNSLTFPTASTTINPAGQAYYGPNFLIGPPTGTNNIQVPGYTITEAAAGMGTGLAVDSAGNLYVANGSNLVLKVAPTGKMSTAAGGGPYSPFLGDGGPATNATLSDPLGVAVDNAGDIYIADTGNNRIRKVSTNGTISTVAGPGSAGGPLGDGGSATSATLNEPTGVAVDSAGDIFIADYRNSRVRKVSPDGTITTVAGNGKTAAPGGSLASLGDGVPATSAILLGPTAVAVDSAGNLYIADTVLIRKVSTSGIITTVAGNGILDANGTVVLTPHGDGGAATLAGFGAVYGLAVDGTGNIYVCDSPFTVGGRVRVITPGGVINTIAGGSTSNPTSPSAPATDVSIAPYGVALGSGGNIYVSDPNGPVWLLTPSSAPVFPLPSAVAANSASAFLGAGGVSSSFAVGGWMEIYGSYLASDARSWAAADFNGANAPTSLDGTSVTIGGQTAFISYISAAQINAQLPSTVGTGAQPLVITTANGPSSTYAVTVKAEVPALLSTPAFKINGYQYAVALFPDGVTYVLPAGAIPGVASRPAQQGDTITLYGTGFGPTTPNVPAGQIVQTDNSLMLPLTVSVGSQTAVVAYAGLAPGVVGLYQFNVVVPKIPSGSSTLEITFNLGTAGELALYLAVQ
jgi:uncharacterized protein (TIGR03437 family)